ncbi:kinase-like protein [Diplogelasinospora grovesii]|uniref:Kinase-like protein n=1 Tax=Diplogelasinospora grovesii TaxID=303347 RepID=A0AAN6MZ83_9PEZI|nr:kinase-like protein [Diplogelasinospora grovesii]
MHTALRDAVQQAWPNCLHAAGAPDAIVDLDGDTEYLDELSPLDSLLRPVSDAAKENSTYECVDHQDLVYMFRASGSSAVVRRRASPSDESEGSLYVLKGINFYDFLSHRHAFKRNRDVFYRAIQTLISMPPHPNILSPPRIFAVANRDGGRAPINNNVERPGTRLSLRDKARWWLQMSLAVEHTHHTAHTYHKDIEPANFLVDDQGNAILIDWEQSVSARYTIAPEADGVWDAAEVVGLASSASPRACEAAEVFSLGRTMWVLLQEVWVADLYHLGPKEIIVSWDEDAKDTPDHWKAVVMRCLHLDPNERIGLTDLVRFWGEQQHISLD